jgi:hypothetical protein
VLDPFVLLQYVASALGGAGIKYFVTGSMASMFYGEPRTTQDIDVVVELGFRDVDRIAAAFPEPEFFVQPESIRHAAATLGQFNVVQVTTALKIDFMCAEDDGYNASRFSRARRVTLDTGVEVVMSAPEDVILKKLEFYRLGGSDKHLRDIASMMKISGETFDRAYLDHWALRLGVQDEWGTMKQRLGW